MTPAAAPRLSAEDRRERVLEAATSAFARSGYAATSTDAVAKEAGVSQPYVVRIFGTKLELFLEVVDRATARMRDAFAAVVDGGEVDLEAEEWFMPLALAYGDLVARDRASMQVMLHGFMAASEPAIGELARRRMGEIYEVVLGSGCTPEQARDFIAQGMLLNVLLSIGAPEHLGDAPGLAGLAECTLGPLLDVLTRTD